MTFLITLKPLATGLTGPSFESFIQFTRLVGPTFWEFYLKILFKLQIDELEDDA